MTVVVTGANGFIGRRVAERCVEAGLDVVAVAQPGTRDSVGGRLTRVLECDLAEVSVLPSLVGSADLLYHLAWVGVGPEARNDASQQLRNLEYSLAMVEAAALMGVTKIVCPGSMSEFALADGPVTGYEDPSPVDLYSATKVAARQLMGVRCAQRGVGLIWTFITSVYGPGRTDSNLISYAIQSLLRGERPSFTGLEQIWDYIYIDDLVDALFLVGQRGRVGRRYPIGSGTALPMVQYVEQIRDTINPELPLGVGEKPYKSAKLDMSIPDISELVRDTGFVRGTSFRDGIGETINYFRAAGDR